MKAFAADPRSLIQNYIKKFKGEFTIGINTTLFCNLCCCSVDFSRKSSVESHRSSKKHIQGMSVVLPSEQRSQQFLTDPRAEFNKKLVEAFLSADIPLYKLRNRKLIDLFEYVNYPLCSETSTRRQTSIIYDEKIKEIKRYFFDRKFFIIIDESCIKGKKYFNILAGLCQTPDKISLIDCVELNGNINAIITISLVENCFGKLNLAFDCLELIISDCAAYMIFAVADIKERYLHVLHIKCLAHLLHNCSMKIRASYSNVDNLIASIKLITHKNTRMKSKFADVGIPPDVIITRWSSWIKAALYYADNLSCIKDIVNSCPPEGIMLQRAKDALNSTHVASELVLIKLSYESLIPILDDFENSVYNIRTGYEALANLNFESDPVKIKEYLNCRLDSNDIKTIALLEDSTISPSRYVELGICPPTSIAVERSFSMLKKLLAMDRNFKQENICKYFCCYYNSVEYSYDSESSDFASIESHD